MATQLNQRTRVAVAGATGEQGLLLCRELVTLGIQPRALVRIKSSENAIRLKNFGAEIAEVDYKSGDTLRHACSEIDCVVSVLSGDREVTVNLQSRLLTAAVDAGVPRFIPSVYSIDFRAVPPGANRNLDVIREFNEILERSKIRSTTIFNGAFADMITGQAPFILTPLRRVLYFSNPDQKMDFTSRKDVAAFTARAALDESAPAFLKIAGDQLSSRDLAEIMSKVKDHQFKLIKAGSTSGLEKVIRALKSVDKGSKNKYPIWQGLQYMHNMFAGYGKLESLDNDRYGHLEWTHIDQILRDYHRAK